MLDTQSLLRLSDHCGQSCSVVTDVIHTAALDTENDITRHQATRATHSAVCSDIHHHYPGP